jgi:hypothetical protein
MLSPIIESTNKNTRQSYMQWRKKNDIEHDIEQCGSKVLDAT